MWFIGVEVEQETSAPLPNKILDPPLTHHLLKRLNRLTKNHNYLVRSGKL